MVNIYLFHSLRDSLKISRHVFLKRASYLLPPVTPKKELLIFYLLESRCPGNRRLLPLVSGIREEKY